MHQPRSALNKHAHTETITAINISIVTVQFSRWPGLACCPLVTSSTGCRRKPVEITGIGLLRGRMSFLSPNQQCQSNEGNSKNRSQPVAWPHPFFIYHRSAEASAAPFTWTVWCQYNTHTHTLGHNWYQRHKNLVKYSATVKVKSPQSLSQHFGDEPFTAIICTGTDNQTHQKIYMIDWVKVLHPTWHEQVILETFFPANLLA